VQKTILKFNQFFDNESHHTVIIKLNKNECSFGTLPHQEQAYIGYTRPMHSCTHRSAIYGCCPVLGNYQIFQLRL